MKRLGKSGNFASTSMDHRPMPKPPAPKCSECKMENNGFCLEHQVQINLIENIEDINSTCFEQK